jgi:hypothetical protein
MIATPKTRNPKRGDYVTILRRYHPRPISGQLTRIEWSAGELFFWLRCPIAGGTIVIPRSRIGRMMLLPRPTKAPTSEAF